jgi:hypothetical protein
LVGPASDLDFRFGILDSGLKTYDVVTRSKIQNRESRIACTWEWEPGLMRGQRWLIVACVLLAVGSTSLRCCQFRPDLPAPGAGVAAGEFLVRPYVQLGEAPARGVAGDLRLLWQTEDRDADWTVAYRPRGGGPWRSAEVPEMRRVAVAGIAPHRVYRATMRGLEPGAEFDYEVRRGTGPACSAAARAPKAAGQPCRFVVFGDCAAGTDEQKAVAFQAYQARPDFVFIAGDIVYTRGRISEYREKFWPVYDSDVAAITAGAPLLRSTLVVAAPGNHDVAARDLNKLPDGLAYFLYWDQPLNGPIGREGGRLVPRLVADEHNRAAFLEAAGPAYPRMANFSFDYGDAHWTVLDSNPYVDWTDPELRAWVERDLDAARDAAWRFVAFHHPPFHSSRAHAGDQRMRVLADVFEAGRVDIVWSGHVHNYQRTFPLTFRAQRGPDGQPVRISDKIPGAWDLDTSYDGRTRTRPRGVIYIITGAGGAGLYNPEQQDAPTSWQPYTQRFLSRIHSLTVADLDGTRLTVRQVSARGEELDRFVVTK